MIAGAIAGALALCLCALPAQAEQNTPARFFRIQDVMAKLDTGKRPDAAAPIRLAAHISGDIMSDVPLRGSLPQIGDEPFGLFGFRAPEGQLWRKWRTLSGEMANEENLLALCRANPEDCTPAAKRFITMSESVQAQAGLAQLHEVNRHVNAAIAYASDRAQHGQVDHWSAPLASLTSGRGDCEDYAIAKYAILRAAGFPPADLRLLLVRDKLARDDHAVLAALADPRQPLRGNPRGHPDVQLHAALRARPAWREADGRALCERADRDRAATGQLRN
jgi:predicted transglutaminase-like cysteine proteinase